MTSQVYFRPRVVPNSCVRVIRKIKGSGTLTVAKNQEVSPHDILGTAQLSPGFTVINLSKELKISPKDAIKSLQKNVGVPIYKGELLAKKKGLFGSTIFVSPTDCVIERTNEVTGDVTLKMLPKQIPLLAGVFGIVDEINTLTGEIQIKTIATQIIGLFGSGRERAGFLRILGGPADLLHENMIHTDQKGAVLVSGGLVFGPSLKKAMEYQIDGLITGGVNMDDYLSITGSLYENRKSHSDIGMSLLATEGFGPMAIGGDIFNTLKGFEGKYVFINGFSSHVILPESSADAIIKARKVMLPPSAVSVGNSHELKSLTLIPNMKVRITWPPFAGGQGIVISIDQTPTLLPSGISAICALVELPNKKIKVPVNNLEAV